MRVRVAPGERSGVLGQSPGVRRPAAGADAQPAQGGLPVLDAANSSLHELDPETQAALRQAEKLTAKGKLGLAVEALSRIIGEHPKTALAFVLRAQANALRHNDADALADFSTAIELEPQKASHYVARGFFQLTRGNTAKSIDDFNTALKLDPKDARAYNDRGMARVTTGELKQAIEDFNQAIELDPKSVSAYTNRSFALIKLDRRNEALADLDRALQLDPKASGAYDSRGVLRLEDHDYQKALADFTSAIKLDGNNADLLRPSPRNVPQARAVCRGTGRRLADRETDAVGGVDRGRLPRPAFAQALPGPGRLPHGRGTDRECDRQFRSCAGSSISKQGRGLIGRARAWIRRGEFQKAVDDSTAALAIDPREDAYAVRGDAYRKLGQYAKAVADYDAAQRIDAEVAETWLLYSRELREAGHAKEADEALKRANDLKSLDAPRVEPSRGDGGFTPRNDRGGARPRTGMLERVFAPARSVTLIEALVHVNAPG